MSCARDPLRPNLGVGRKAEALKRQRAAFERAFNKPPDAIDSLLTSVGALHAAPRSEIAHAALMNERSSTQRLLHGNLFPGASWNLPVKSSAGARADEPWSPAAAEARALQRAYFHQPNEFSVLGQEGSVVHSLKPSFAAGRHCTQRVLVSAAAAVR